ncbi:MAG: SCP2 sterol-binding domain-containing protein [Deltaproteobacteria bacterium]|nr:SCP2 sterol-binding domain-containing protein [Deltaproteobacteria bacterium]
MSQDVVTFLRETFPRLFEKGVSDLEAKAAGGDAKAQAALDDVKGATGAVVLEVEGVDTVYLRADAGKMTVLDAAPDGSDVKLAVAAPSKAMQTLLGEAQAAGELEDESKAAKRAVMTASKRLQDALGDTSLEFHVIATGVPDLDEVTIKIGLNAPEPPAEPKFTATIAYSDLEAMQTGETNIQMLFMGGKLRMAGDYSSALQMGMQLMAQMQQQ